MKKMSNENKQALDCWRRNEGEARPKRQVGATGGNLNAMRHGIFANKCLDEEERVLFREVIDRLYLDFEFNRSSDFLQIEFVGINTVKYMRAMAEGNLDAAQKLDAMIRANMKDVKTTKISREGDQPQAPQATPADWAADLLGKSGTGKGGGAKEREGGVTASPGCFLARAGIGKKRSGGM
jgi:hypothetical protein